MKSCIIIGGGIVGLATAWKLTQTYPNAKITLLEKENATATHQSTHNSGVLHCGLYYKPGSLKAQMAVQGIAQMTQFCRTYDIPHEICGKLVVATNTHQESLLDNLLQRGAQNGLSGLKKIDRNEMLKIEPNVAGRSAALVPQEGIVNYMAICKQLSTLIASNCGEIKLNAKVVEITRIGQEWTVQTEVGEQFQSDWIINCAGLHSDRVAAMGNAKTDTQIIPFRGEYFRLTPEAEHLVKNLIYPVPNPSFPFLGVHFTRLISGGIEAGPNAILAFAREGYNFSDFRLKDLAQSIAFPGLWNFIRKNFSTTLKEFHQSLSKAQFCKNLQELIPEIREQDLTTGGAGVRAQAMTPQGELVQDFIIIKVQEKALHILNAPSPAATASLAIADYIASHLH